MVSLFCDLRVIILYNVYNHYVVSKIVGHMMPMSLFNNWNNSCHSVCKSRLAELCTFFQAAARVTLLNSDSFPLGHLFKTPLAICTSPPYFQSFILYYFVLYFFSFFLCIFKVCIHFFFIYGAFLYYKEFCFLQYYRNRH